MIVGLTGGIGSGKSTVLSFFKKKEDVATYIADEKAKMLMQQNLLVKKQLVAVFGKETYLKGKVNRKYLSSIIFKNPEKLSQINNIVHPAVKKDFSSFYRHTNAKIVIYESAILFEANSANSCHKIISVSAPLSVRLERVVKRDATTKEQVMSRVSNQLTDTQRNLQSHYIIFNHSINDTVLQVDRIYNFLTKNSNYVS